MKRINQKTILETREQIQEDIISCLECWRPEDYMMEYGYDIIKDGLPSSLTDDVCQIVVNNFKKLEE